MIKKNVTYFEYQILKAIYTDVTVLNANDTSATIVIGKQINNINRRSWHMKYFKDVNT